MEQEHQAYVFQRSENRAGPQNVRCLVAYDAPNRCRCFKISGVELRWVYSRSALLHELTIDQIGEGLQIDTIGFVIGQQQFERLRIPTMSPSRPHSYRIPAVHAL